MRKIVIAQIHVDGVSAVVSKLKKVPKGIVGAAIQVTFSSEWTNLGKTAVFQGADTKDVLVNERTITIPAECVAESGYLLRVGFYGVSGDTLAIPTIWANMGTIQDATDPSGDTSTDPTLPVWGQMHGQIAQNKEDIEKLNTDKLDADQLPEAINTALAQAKASGEFDGKDGQDGYTPQKNVDYFDGKDGSNGSNGKDGTSVTVKSVSESTADGGSNVVTFSDGKTVTIKNGSKGSTGAAGKTPVKGTDYFTAADKAEMVNAVIATLPIYGGEYDGEGGK